MKISYAITVCNELEEVKRLVPFLKERKRPQDEIVILYDQKNGNEEIAQYLKQFNILPNVQFWRGFFDNHFGDWKNKLTEYCSGDYIFQLDADEVPTETLINLIPQILESNPGCDVYLVPRINTVEGLTEAHIKKWHWNVDEENKVNWPDYQWRLYKKDPSIKWVNKVHERLSGFKTYSHLPAIDDFAILHPKTIERQEKQNNYYETL